MINPKAFGPTPGGYRRSTGGGLQSLLSSRRPSLEEDSGTRERFLPLEYQYNPLLGGDGPPLPGLDTATDAVATTATPDVPSANLLDRERQNQQTRTRNIVGQLVREQPDEMQQDIRLVQKLLGGAKQGVSAGKGLDSIVDLFRTVPEGIGPLRADLGSVLEDFGPSMSEFSGARASAPSPTMPPGESGFGMGDVSAGLSGAGGALSLLAALTDDERSAFSRVLGAGQGLAGLVRGVSGLSAVQGAAPQLAGTAGGIAGAAGGALGLLGGGYAAAKGDPVGAATGLTSGALTAAGAAGAFPAAASASAAAGGGMSGALAGAGAAAAPALAVSAPLLIGAIANYFAQQDDDKSKARVVKNTFGEIQRTREMASGMIDVFKTTPFAEAVHMRMPGEEQGTTIGEVLRAMAERNVRGNMLEGGTYWEPNAKYGALIAALDEAGVKRGGYDGAKAEFLVSRAMPGKAKNWGTNAYEGGAFWDQILGPLADHVLKRDPTLMERGMKPPPPEQWMERGLRYAAGPYQGSPGGRDPRSLADLLDVLQSSQDEANANYTNPRIAQWWQQMAKRTKYRPSAGHLAQLTKYRDDMQQSGGD